VAVEEAESKAQAEPSRTTTLNKAKSSKTEEKKFDLPAFDLRATTSDPEELRKLLQETQQQMAERDAMIADLENEKEQI
jgi:hypothetical protein